MHLDLERSIPTAHPVDCFKPTNKNQFGKLYNEESANEAVDRVKSAAGISYEFVDRGKSAAEIFKTESLQPI